MKNYRVIHKDKVYKIFFVYPSGYMEIRDPETREVELVNVTDIQIINDDEAPLDWGSSFIYSFAMFIMFKINKMVLNSCLNVDIFISISISRCYPEIKVSTPSCFLVTLCSKSLQKKDSREKESFLNHSHGYNFMRYIFICVSSKLACLNKNLIILK